MSNFLKLFNSHLEYQLYATSNNFITPNVSRCINLDEVHYTPEPFLIRLTLNTGEIVLIESYNEVSAYKSVCVGAELGEYFSTSSGLELFKDFNLLEIVKINPNVDSLYFGTFMGCTKLKTINLENVTNIYDSAFSGCSSLNNITLNENLRFATMKDAGIFSGCSSLTSINIPNGNTYIGNNMFNGCSSLTSITIPNSVTSIGERTFYECRNLSSITIPNSVTSIGEWAFCDCSSLTSVTIPNGVTNIGQYTFNGCTGLTSIDIPSGVTNIGEWAFCDCSNLMSINIPYGVTTISRDTFNGCSSLISVNIPDSVTSINRNAFKDCSGLTSIMIGSSVTSIGAFAFQNCSSLTSINIPNSVTTIGNGAFSGCANLVSITSNATTAPSINSATFRNVKTGGTLYVPTDATGYDVWMGTGDYYLGKYEWTMESSYRMITYKASTKLTETTEEDDSGLHTDAFTDANGNTLTITSHTFANGVGTIKFNGDVAGIGYEAFYDCDGMTSITIPDSIISIGEYAFSDSDDLTSINIYDGVTSIGESAFNGCSNLTSVNIPISVTSIGNYAFRDCYSLSSITSNATTAPSITNTTFDNVKTGGTLYVPTGATGYNTWMGTGNYYLGKYNWTKIEQ